MAVTLVPMTVNVAKETDDVMVLLVDLVKSLKTGSDFKNVIGDLMVAVQGIQAVPEEVKSATFEVLNSVSLRGVQIAEALLGSPVVNV